jgi:type III secretion protein R
MTPLALGGPVADRPAELIVLIGLFALLPTALVLLTSFLKMSVVLSIARSALGAPQVPPTSAITGMALALSVLVMAPVLRRTADLLRAAPPAATLEARLATLERASGPLREFLSRFARPDDRAAFLDVARRLAPAASEPEQANRGHAGGPAEDDLAVLAPAFVVSELRRAFTIGFLVFLPFLVVDLAVANVLLALGLGQVSPTAVALPLKLLLFVAVDGWRLLARALALSYAG